MRRLLSVATACVALLLAGAADAQGALGTWTTAGTPMPSQRSGSAVAVYHDRVLMIGGEYGGGAYTKNEAYDPRTDTWSTLAPLPEGRHGTGAAVAGDALYLPAGAPVNGGSRQSNTLFVFRQS